MTMVEKVAKAIHEKAYETRGADRMPDWEAVAKAAIEAMREPTQEMLNARHLITKDNYIADETDNWRAMIDAALTDGKSE
jgi:hypothetical protein